MESDLMPRSAQSDSADVCGKNVLISHGYCSKLLICIFVLESQMTKSRLSLPYPSQLAAAQLTRLDRTHKTLHFIRFNRSKCLIVFFFSLAQKPCARPFRPYPKYISRSFSLHWWSFNWFGAIASLFLNPDVILRWIPHIVYNWLGAMNSVVH